MNILRNLKHIGPKDEMWSIWTDRQEEDVGFLFENNFDKKIGADIITTGNELIKQEIAELESGNFTYAKNLTTSESYHYFIGCRILK